MRIRHLIKLSLLALTTVTTAQTAYSGSSFTLSNRNVSKWKLTISNNKTVPVLLVQIIKQGSFLIGLDGSEVLKTPENSNITVNAIVNGLVVVE